ncbi:carboxy-terminal kinesin 2-like isoform X2 [Anas platyrhynchos]|uniref:carboxy-terminal kinesin 2-like isoform X2 n=1 Tax=Anas platyrhynchos TaxID=8839 RepID=UPI003AF2C8BA
MGARGGRGLSVSAAMAARPGGGGGARPVPATAAAASLPAASRLPVRKAHAKRAAAAPEPEAPEQKRRRSGPRAGWAPSSRAPLRAISVPTAPGPGLLRKAMTVAAAPQAGKKAPGAASGSAAPPPVPGVRRRAAGDPRGQLAELREKIRGLEDDNRQLREQLQHSRAREEELEGQVSSLRTELQQSQEERSRWQREAEAQAAERQRLAAELQERHRQLEELREAARDREEQLGAAQAELRALAGAQEEHLHALEMERRRLHNQLQELKGNIRVFCCVRPLLAAEQEAQKGLEHLHFPPEDNKTLVLCRTEGSHTGRRGEGRYDFSFDRVFPPGASQEDVFEEIALLVQSALDGYPVCIFAYGQTGSGKTYTMEGPGGADPTSWGVIPRAVRHLFGGARQLEHKGWQFQRQLSGDLQRGAVGPAGGGQGGRAGDPPRQDKCQASGQRLRETQAINSSLATLGLLIMAISNKEPHVPYHNSKLTYLLQNSLRGNAKMLMFVNISPLEENLAESLSSLRFASKELVECCVLA